MVCPVCGKTHPIPDEELEQAYIRLLEKRRQFYGGDSLVKRLITSIARLVLG